LLPFLIFEFFVGSFGLIWGGGVSYDLLLTPLSRLRRTSCCWKQSTNLLLEKKCLQKYQIVLKGAE
jgi:hypothetical protein